PRSGASAQWWVPAAGAPTGAVVVVVAMSWSPAVDAQPSTAWADPASCRGWLVRSPRRTIRAVHCTVTIASGWTGVVGPAQASVTVAYVIRSSTGKYFRGSRTS